MKTKIDCGCEKDVFACRNHAHPALDVTGLSHDLRDLKYKPEHIAFIVRAVNSHEELLEALKGAIRAIEYLSGTTQHSLIYNAAKKAIAKAL